MKGFIVGDYADEFEEATKQLAAWVASGDLKYEETILTGFDRIPEAFIGLFTGRNTGKLLVDVSQ
jgi:NADPH-dependent curcumin reductase CurA